MSGFPSPLKSPTSTELAATPAGERHASRERAHAVALEHRDGARSEVGDDEIQHRVLVEVRRRDPPAADEVGGTAGGEIGAREAAIAVAEQDGDDARCRRIDGDVGIAVAVEVAGKHRHRLVAGAEECRGGEAARPVAEEHPHPVEKALLGRGDVVEAVIVEVLHADRAEPADGECRRQAEGARRRAEMDGHDTGAGVADGDVAKGIVVEVAGGHGDVVGAAVLAGEDLVDGRELAGTVVQQDEHPAGAGARYGEVGDAVIVEVIDGVGQGIP